MLGDLVEDSRNTIYVMSGRRPEELERLFRLVPNLGLIAENGCFVRSAGQSSWTDLADREKVRNFKESVRTILQYYLERTPGSEIEERSCSLIFNSKNAEDFDQAQRQASDWTGHINESCEEQRVHATQLEACVVAEPIDWTKETAAAKIYQDYVAEKGTTPELVLVVGDGREDEKVFKWANALQKGGDVKEAVTVSLGTRNTEAKTTLTQGVSGKQTVSELSISVPKHTNPAAGVLVTLLRLAGLS